MEELVKHVVNYRAQNGLEPIEHLRASIEDYLCQQPENGGKCMEYKLGRGLFATYRGGVAVVKNFLFGKKEMVSEDVADERATQCLDCPLNIFPDKDGFIEFSDRLAEASTGGLKSKHYDDLGNCAACSCVLKMKVWKKGPFTVSDKEKALMESVDCWQLKELKET